MGKLISDVVEVGSLGLIKDPLGLKSGAEASRKASATQVASQEEALAYLREREALPMQFRDEALTEMAGLYGLGDDPGAQRRMVEQIQASPMYQEQIATGEESVMRHANMTGMGRSGNVKAGLAGTSRDVMMNMYNQQMQGLQGFAAMPSNANVIAQQMGGIGATRAQGIMAPEQMQQDITGSIMQGIGAGATAAFSDPRLKDGVTCIGESGGHNIYRWVWNKAAEEVGLFGDGFGVMADEVKQAHPDAIGECDGYMTVDYSLIGVAHG